MPVVDRRFPVVFSVEEGPAPLAPSQFARVAQRHREVARRLQGHRYRLLWARPELEESADGLRHSSSRGEALFFDYSQNVAVVARGDQRQPAQWEVETLATQPQPSWDEFADAVALVRRSPAWGPLLQAGHVRPYQPMPPMLEPLPGETVERTLYVGLISKPRRFNQIVAVNLIRQEVSPGGVQPRGSRASGLQICGYPDAPCIRNPRYLPGKLTLEWPSENPVWRFTAVRPAFSSASNGSGIELLDVRYKGHRVFKQAHLPILNVQYAEDACGPFRDWTYDETCFEAIGADIVGSEGFRWCTQPPRTIIESGDDAGNFKGVAVYEAEDGALVLVTELSAGWYRYIMEWRFHLDGRIQPRFRFDGVEDSCICEIHNHHAFWRFDWDVVRPQNVLLEQLGAVWVPQLKELTRFRQEGISQHWRVYDPKSGAGYEIIPGPDDGVGDPFSGPDFYALRYRPRELDDGSGRFIFEAKHNLAALARNQSINKKNLVTWYAAHFRHAVAEESHQFSARDHDAGLNFGPDLVPFSWPQPKSNKKRG